MMWRYVWPAVLLVILPACDSLNNRADSEDVIAGGYGDGNLSEEGAQTALRLVETAIYDRYPSRAEIDQVQLEVQVVAGLNYRFRIEMSGAPESRAVYEAVVYRDLEDSYELTSLTRLQ